MGKVYKTVEILFFGAGKIGRYWLECCKDFGIVPEGILDNDENLRGKLCEDVIIYHPDDLKRLSFAYIFITCSRSGEVYRQLLELGVAEGKMIIGSDNILNHLLFCMVSGYAVSHYAVFSCMFSGQELTKGLEKTYHVTDTSKILFDLRNGMVLGGVESWVYGLAVELKKSGYQGLYLATDAEGPEVIDRTFPAQVLRYKNLHKEKDKVELCVKIIMENLPCTIICNFPQHIFWSACIVKWLYPDMVRIVAVQHNDERAYFETYGLWRGYIDRCMVISSRIEKKLLSFGMEKNRIGYLGWKVACEEELVRPWNMDGTCLQIGYAGRITTAAKRVDLLPMLAARLKEKGICFRMNIAGAGEYRDILQQRIAEEGLQECMRLVGYVDRKDIPLFWKEQDIMVSCSEWEGHSISQSEAMAGGAVPVLTDVSGAEDDVTDGYNGFIVEVGDVDGLADRICCLYHDRSKLKRMGQNAHDTIYQRQVHMDQAGFWSELLEEVWRK